MSRKMGYRDIKLDFKYINIILIIIIITILLFYLYPRIQENNNSDNSPLVYNSTDNYTDDEDYKQYFIFCKFVYLSIIFYEVSFIII